MKLTFEDNTLPANIKKTVEKILSANKKKMGDIIVEYIPEDEVDLYDDPDNFVESHKDTCDMYMVYQDLNTWNQPLTMVAVEY